MIIGIDPSQRHTGVCILGEDLKISKAYDIKTGDLSILDSVNHLRLGLRDLFKEHPTATYSVEKMMPSARSGALLFYVQMALLEELVLSNPAPKLVHPLPIQLKSFMIKKFGFDPGTKTAIVEAAKKHTGYVGRMSSHMADAYFLARMADAVINHRYSYPLSKVELQLFTWKVINGN